MLLKNSIVYFFLPQAEQGYIFYVHDGSETMADNFTVVANDTDIRKQSLPFVIYVNITPINDEAPVVTVNRILKVSFSPLKLIFILYYKVNCIALTNPFSSM